ncbi:aldehyde dehydrogenase family protein [Mesorhizobium sp. B3-1-3]|uniref:aldehyde dehydrogenase family protein n=1 Tax=unclassified Mesorhizobium TaxID=325217 RepID=UPI001127A787|nr:MULTISPECIES: aldehyde dehydrogenase family protein [unclassified Mesorhizobium]TPI56041.1 aldehyde dehydrogenase family protein [Mesorhizobium sp. B3-1-8]TPI63335.1 aldehyde dehydrogenase family protein [Mesorhizobium sp. B3-1-3]
MEHRLLIGGERIATAKHEPIKNPSTGAVVGHMPLATAAQLDLAVAAAEAAFGNWGRTADAERQQACRAIAEAISDHAEELALLLTQEQGKPMNGLGSRFEIGGAIAWTRYTAELKLPVEVLQDNNEGRVELHRKPIGVVGSITPWNWPVMIACWHIIPAVRAGNTVVIKPSPLTPLSTIRLVEIINTVLPAGVVNVVTGENSIGAALSAHPNVAKMTFTGSTETGKKIMASAVGTLKRLTLELGGNDAGIVLPDVDPKRIAEGLFWGAFINNGQTCAALKRLYVHDSIYDEVCAALADYAERIVVGDGMDEESVLGPIQNEIQFNKVRELVDDARANGGRILTGGAPMDRPGYFYPITLVADVTDGMRIVEEEQFGPTLPIIRYSDVDEVIERANRNPAGLGGSVWSSDPEKAKHYALKLECGSVWINKHGAIQPNAPFGGVKNSGIGVEFGAEGLKEFTTIQTVLS